MAGGDEPGAIFLPVPAANIFPGYWGHSPRWIVIHKTASAGSAEDIAAFFAHDPAQASAHYIVGTDGALVQCVREADGAGANCCLKGSYAPFLPTGINLNLLTISIEHCDASPTNNTPLTAAQKATSFRLVADICQRHDIPARRGDAAGGIIGHCDIDPIDRANCPGNYPWNELFAYLKGASAMIPAGWHDDGATLTAQNGHRVVKGFRDYVLAHAWDTGNAPLGEEYGADPVLLHNRAVGAGTVQLFRDGMLWWTPATGVINEPYVGWELAAAYATIATLKAGQPPAPPPPPQPPTQPQTPPASVVADLKHIQDDASAALKDLNAGG